MYRESLKYRYQIVQIGLVNFTLAPFDQHVSGLHFEHDLGDLIQSRLFRTHQNRIE